MLRELEEQIWNEILSLPLKEKIKLYEELAKEAATQKVEEPAVAETQLFDLGEVPVSPVLYNAEKARAIIADKFGFTGRYSEQAISRWVCDGMLQSTPSPLGGRHKYLFSERQIDDFVQRGKKGEFSVKAPFSRKSKKEAQHV